jgi:mevalonate kinase
MGEMVAHVGELRNQYQSVIDKIIGAGGEIVARSIEALDQGDLETLGEMMNINHALLCAVGVSNESIDKMVYAARKAGAFGAKLTGGGGGGCIVALSKPERVQDVAEAIKQAGEEAFVTKMTMEGVRIEK